VNIVFAGTPAFAAVALDALLRAGHEIRLVLTQPDRPSGRGLAPRPSAVKRMALARGLSILQPVSLTVPELGAAVAAQQPDALVVAAYGLIIPRSLLGLARLGALNIHASLLPRWRGAAPIQRALLAGDRQTGITIMQMDEGLDTGDILLQEAIEIGAEDTAGSLHDRLAALGSELIVKALATPCVPVAQDASQACYAAKIDRREALIDWTEHAAVIERKVRAFNPAPGASTQLDGETLKIWRATDEPDAAGPPGQVLDSGTQGILVACGSGALRILELQRAGGRRMHVSAFLAGYSVARRAQLG
jgi:methionyl-tRNA formyltransferase